MKKKSSKKQRVSDNEFDAMVEASDLGAAIKEAVVIEGRRGRKKIGTRVSLILPELLLEEVKLAADKKAVGYQTLIRIIVAENIKKYSA